tara:strand:+ start:117 stop:1124 length:1008 start_codon:yes stop_codon:yes gene_type:complete
MNSISKLLAICCIAVLLAGCGVSELAYVPTEGEPATIAWKKGDEEAANSEWEAAIASYTEAIRLRTTSPQAYLGRAKAYGFVGEMKSTDPAAIRIISRLRERLRSDTKHPGHLLNEAIISDLSEAIRLNPDLGPELKRTLQNYQNIIDNKVVMTESAGPRPTALQPNLGDTPTSSRNICIIAECSGSMTEGTKWPALKQEILETIESLMAPDKFQVCFFNSAAIPFPRQKWRDPNRDLTALESWLEQISPSGGTVPLSAFTYIFQNIKPAPDVVFFVTDGSFDSNEVPQILRTVTNINGKNVVVNTICLGSKEGEIAMQDIAKQTGGKYRYVPAP